MNQDKHNGHELQSIHEVFQVQSNRSLPLFPTGNLGGGRNKRQFDWSRYNCHFVEFIETSSACVLKRSRHIHTIVSRSLSDEFGGHIRYHLDEGRKLEVVQAELYSCNTVRQGIKVSDTSLCVVKVKVYLVLNETSVARVANTTRTANQRASGTYMLFDVHKYYFRARA